MKTKIENYLGRSGFQKLGVDIPGMSIYFTIEKSYINAFVLADVDGETKITAELLDDFLDKSDWKAQGGQTIDVHALSILFSSDMDKARQVGSHQVFCWYVDTVSEKLVIDPDKCEDFYGMKSILEKAIAEPEPKEQESQEKTAVVKPQERDLCYINYGLLVWNTVLFLLCIFNADFFYEKGMFDPEYIFEKQWYRFLTSMFLHSDVYHLSGNMIYLYALGDIVERELGHLKYALLYIFSGLTGNALSLLFSVMTNDLTPSLGASGAIFGLNGALLWIIIRKRGRHMEITLPKIIFLIAYSLYNGFISTNVNNVAHLGGLIGGFVLAILLYREKGKAKERGTKE